METNTKPIVILCVDDEPIILFTLKQELRNRFGSNFQYEIAINAEEALSILAELSHAGIMLSLVISDWMMPGMKGDQFLIHAHKLYPNVEYFIMVTGHADHEAIERVKKEAATYAVFPKPWDRNKLSEAVMQCCNKN